jgi:hypothetical protein
MANSTSAAQQVTLTDVIAQLQNNNKTAERTEKHLSKYFKEIRNSRLQSKENTIEAGQPRPAAGEKSDAYRAGADFNMTNLLNPSKMLMPLLAGATALFGAFSGLRGWEVDALKKIKNFKVTFPTTIGNGLRSMRNSILTKMFGLTPEGNLNRNALGQFTGGRSGSVMAQMGAKIATIREAIMKPFQGIIKFFGGIKTTALNIFGKLKTGIAFILSPFKAIFDFVAGFMSGGGNSAIGGIVKGAAKFGRYFLAFLKPIGAIFSIFAGYKAMMAKQGNLIDKIGAFLGAAVADFIGAPLDLITKVMSWAAKKLGFTNLSESLDKFSFTEMIDNLIGSFFDGINAIVDWFKLLFSDPVGALIKLAQGFKWYAEGISSIFWGMVDSAVGWVTDLFGWTTDDGQTFSLSGWVSGKWEEVKRDLSAGWAGFTDWITSIPSKLSFWAQEKWINMMATFQKAFLEFGDWVSGIPDRLYLNALETLNKKADWLVADSAVESARAAVNSRSSDLANQLAEIDANAAASLANLKAAALAAGVDGHSGQPIIINQNSTGGSSLNAPSTVVTPDASPYDRADRMPI